MALADIIASITHWISSFLWVCSQPLYWIHCIYETNYDAVSALFSAIIYCLFYTAKAVQLLLFGILSMVQLIIDVLASLKYVFRFISSATFALIKFGIQISQFSVSVFRMVLEYGPWVIEKVWRGAVWCYAAIAYCINWALDSAGGLPTPSMLLEPLKEPLKGIVSFLYDAVVSFGSWLIAAGKTVSDALTEVQSLAFGLVTGALTAALDAFLRFVGDLWQMRTAVEDSIMMAKAYSGRKAAEIYTEILEASSNAFGSFVDLMVALVSTISYVGIFAIVCLLLVLIPLKLYNLFVNALRSANTMMNLFHRALSRGERNHLRQPRYQQNVEQRLPRERDAFDTDDDESLLRPRRTAPRVPQPRPQSAPQPGQQQVPAMQPPYAPPAANGAGPSGEQNQRRVNPRRSSPSPPASNPPVPESTTTSAANDLARQLEEERDRQLCVVCQDNGKNILILPCKHLCICLECVEEITGQPRRDARKCPLCRQAIRSYLEVYA
ncbi:uncharacterized protein LOC119734348 [Patiria miniata]|uniref:RING-type domain-containing protein n=1 Tax=Patiria miniata TaxID=46514 RepID=A0A914AJZ0_PATMI|nr:uncharacterized protein LOC119734348 [Patiria miniata]XP_038063735.1 uncharacterized protein LOC119734348 [Patiria miniata]